jgi:hypothetical protein
MMGSEREFFVPVKNQRIKKGETMYTQEKVDRWMEEAERIAKELQALSEQLPHALDRFALADVAEAAARGDGEKTQASLDHLRHRLELMATEHRARSVA